MWPLPERSWRSPRRNFGAAFVRRARRISSQNQVAHHERVHSSAQETIERFFGLTDDRLVVVERGVHDDGHAGEIAESANEFPVERIGAAAYGL